MSFDSGGKLYGFAPDAQIKINKVKGLNCQGVRGAHSSLSLSNLRVVVQNDHYFICPVASLRGAPKLGLIGDLQISGNDVRFDWTSIQCDGDWFRTDSCRFLSAPNVSKVCMELPALSGGVKLFQNKGSLYASLDSSSTLVVGSCGGKLITREDECFNIRVKIIGTRKSLIGLSLVASAMSKESSGSTIIHINCSSILQIHLPCDGGDHFVALSEEDKCTGVTDETRSLSGFSSYEIEVKRDNAISFLRLHDSHFAIVSGFWIGVVILIMVIYTCFCRSH